jgi:secreted trypsin-like serine protease
VNGVASPIIGGAVTTGDPAVVLLISYPADQSTFDTCTASLIAPTVLLTAAHCVDAANHPGYGFGVFTGPDASAYATVAALKPKLIAVQSVHAHPDYNPAPPFHADLAVVVLAKPLLTAPLPISRTAPTAALVGGPARIVGYGQIQYKQYNVIKHEAPTVVAALGVEDTIVVGDTVHRSCIGDSGGPALVVLDGVETIVGVDSYTELSGCLEPAHYRRTDVYTAFLDQYAPPPPPPVDAGLGGGGGSSSSGSSGVGGATVATSSSATSASGGDEAASSGCAVGGDRAGDCPASLAALLAAAALWRRAVTRRRAA